MSVTDRSELVNLTKEVLKCFHLLREERGGYKLTDVPAVQLGKYNKNLGINKEIL
jgi:hypothetical protein